MPKFTYVQSADQLEPDRLSGLPVGWPNPPTVHTLLKSLRRMGAVLLALDEAGDVAGFVCGFSDELLVLYIWTIEVRAEHEGSLERELLQRLLERYDDIYQVNVHPDERHRGLYEAMGFKAYEPDQALAMTRMNMALQDGGRRAAER